MSEKHWPSIANTALPAITASDAVVGGGRQLRIIEDHGDGSATKELFERDQIQ